MKYTRFLLFPLACAIAPGCAIFGRKAEVAPAPKPAAAVPAPPKEAPRLFGAPLYHQEDPRWAGVRMGRSRHTIGSGGCMVCCVAMAYEALGIPTDPGQFVAYLNANGGFTASGNLKWHEMVQYGRGTVRLAYAGKGDPALLDTYLAKNAPVIAKVNLPNGQPHWVLILKKFGNTYVARDPLSKEDELVPVTRPIQAMRVLSRVQ